MPRHSYDGSTTTTSRRQFQLRNRSIVEWRMSVQSKYFLMKQVLFFQISTLFDHPIRSDAVRVDQIKRYTTILNGSVIGMNDRYVEALSCQRSVRRIRKSKSFITEQWRLRRMILSGSCDLRLSCAMANGMKLAMISCMINETDFWSMTE